MPSTRRDFLQLSAAAAAGLTMGPKALEATASAPIAAGAAPVPREIPAIKAFEAKMMRARPVALNKVRVTGGPLKHAQDITATYLLSLDPDRMLASYRLRAGLPKKAEMYAGWDGTGHNLTGHIAGHHLSAVSYMWEATGDVRFKQRADYMVSELKLVQDKNGDGFLSGLEVLRTAFGQLSKGEIRSQAFDLNGVWSPWYTLHKTFAGLRDAYRHTGNVTALAVETKFAAWAEGVLTPLDESQVQRMLNTEHGGMNEVLADLYADTGNKRWLDLSLRFEHHAFTDALKRHQDNLSGKHGNCQIPKLLGSAARYGYTGELPDIIAASFFWDRVAQHHSYVTGGDGLEEYFGPPDVFAARADGRAAETCNVYNMIKLTRRLFSFRPDATYADFHERALFNHILGSIDPNDGRVSYMVPVGRGVEQEYQDPITDMTCCCGTGMESHALHGYGVYYESADTVWVNLFVPSTVQLSTGAARLVMETGFPDGDTATMKLSLPAPKAFTLAVRRPVWAGDGFAVKVNGTSMPQPPIASFRAGGAGGRGGMPGLEGEAATSSYVELKRTWKSGDTVEISIPKTVRVEPTPDNRQVAALMWGPLALAADWGPRREGRGGPAPAAIPVLVAGDKPLTEWLVAGSRQGDFTAKQVARVPAETGGPSDVSLTPFHRTHRRRYSIYMDVLTPAEFDARAAALAKEKERTAKIETATVMFVQPGDPQPEKEANYQSDNANRPVQRNNGRASRGGTGWFSYDLKVDPAGPTSVVVTYQNVQGQPPATGNFELQVDGTHLAQFASNATATGFFMTEYPVPADLVKGKSKITVRFQALTNGRIAPVYGVRTIRGG